MIASLRRRLEAAEAVQAPPAVDMPSHIRLVGVHPDGSEELGGVIVVDWARRGGRPVRAPGGRGTSASSGSAPNSLSSSFSDLSPN